MQSERKSTSGLYWTCQLVGWGGYGLGYYVTVLVPFHATEPTRVMADAAYCLTGLLGTHLLRLVMKKRRWSELTHRSLALRLIPAVLLLGTLGTGALYGTLTLVGLMDWSRSESLPILTSTLFFSAFLIVLWLAVYLAVLAARRRRAAETEALRIALVAHEARLRSLQQQLNPHFLFNCLNSLRGMIDEDAARAREMVTRLAELLRASLRQDERNAIPLDEELATVNAYLELESVRLEERLSIRREIDDQTLGALVPPMLMQGLVENALKHGITPLADGGELSLSIRRIADKLRIEVGNTGTLRTPRNGGIGLANTRERLRLLYGANAELSLSENPPGWVCATVLLPLQIAESSCER
jgi:signal transduction histidine kinase